VSELDEIDQHITDFVRDLRALGGLERVLNAYRTAVLERYRFYSYGDAMIVV